MANVDLIENNQFKIERHPWELSRFDFFAKLIRQIGDTNQNGTILDVGSGDAWFAAQLFNRKDFTGTITCWDKGYDDEQHAQIKTNLTTLGLSHISTQPKEKFDLILMLDVLEHVEEDELFLKNIIDHNLNPNGALLISVPAWPFLFGKHDRKLQHLRRYIPGEITKMVRRANGQIIKKGGLFSSLFLCRAIEHLILKNHDPAGLEDFDGGVLITSIIRLLLNFDAQISYLLSKLGIDFLGLSWWAICKKQP